MFYKILGYIVWNGAKLFLRRKTDVPKPVVAGAAVALVLGLGGAAAAAKARGDS